MVISIKDKWNKESKTDGGNISIKVDKNIQDVLSMTKFMVMAGTTSSQGHSTKETGAVA